MSRGGVEVSESQATSAGRATMAPLFVRIPTEQARRLDRASFERGRPKQALVAELVEQYLDAPSQTGGRRRRYTVEALEPEPLQVGQHSFRAYEPEHDDQDEVLRSWEAAALLKVDEALVEQLAQAGELPGRRLAGEWRFARAALLAWLSEPQVPAARAQRKPASRTPGKRRASG
jgi:excisionase family DNA binding protein